MAKLADMDDPASPPQDAAGTPQVVNQRRVMTVLMLAIFIDAMGLGIIAPVAPRLIRELTGQDLSSGATLGGWLTVTYAAMQFLFAPVLGSLSDRIGRKPVLLGSLATLMLDYLLMALAPTILWLFIGRTIAGIAGATFSTASAVVADVSTPEQRAAKFGLVGAAWGVGFIAGPAIGGLLGHFGSRAPFFLASGLVALNLLLMLTLMRETLAPANRRSFRLRRANFLGAVRSLAHVPHALPLLGVVLCYQIAHDALPATWTWSTMLRFGWTELEVGLSLTAIGVCTVIVQGGLVGPITRRIGENRAVLLGFAAGAVGMLGYGFAPNATAMLSFLPLACVLGLAMPSVRSIMSRAVPANAQGELQGAISGVMSVTAIASPFFMTQLFHLATKPDSPVHLPGAPFLAAAVVLVLAVLLFSQARAREQLAPQRG